MKHKLDILKWLVPALLLSVASCVTESIDSCPEEPEQSGNWITLQFYVSEESSVTRANPLGGEEGNGREDEICNEAKIHDLNIFLFADNASLLNAEPNTVLSHLYFNFDDPDDEDNTLSFIKEPPSDDNPTQNNSKTIYTVKFMDDVPGIVTPLRNQGTVRFITVANLGHSMKDELTKNEKICLEDLWSYSLLNSTWKGSGQNVSEGYDCFVMTTAYDDVATNSFISFSSEPGAGTESNPFHGKTTLQRMCARIDVMYADDNLKVVDGKTELQYRAGTSDNTVHILNMLPVNVMSKPSYLFKKVTNVVPTDWTNVDGYTWGGKESTDANGKPSNYVLEPNTLLKESLSGNSLTGKQVSWYGATRTANVKEAIENVENGTVGGYHHDGLKTKDTGFESYTKIAVLGYANENTQSPNQYNSNYLTGIAFRAVYVPAEIQPSLTQTTDKPTKIYRYSPSKAGVVDESESIYFSDKATCDAYQDSHKDDMAVISEFDAVEHDGKQGFECYYNLWLRHYDDVDDNEPSDPHATFPMQYATVRNNIYRVGIKFNGPGDPTPTMREPETMQARIFVRKWNQRKETDPLRF